MLVIILTFHASNAAYSKLWGRIQAVVLEIVDLSIEEVELLTVSCRLLLANVPLTVLRYACVTSIFSTKSFLSIEQKSA
jgi:hypothetical protein